MLQKKRFAFFFWDPFISSNKGKTGLNIVKRIAVSMYGPHACQCVADIRMARMMRLSPVFRRLDEYDVPGISSEMKRCRGAMKNICEFDFGLCLFSIVHLFNYKPITPFMP